MIPHALTYTATGRTYQLTPDAAPVEPCLTHHFELAGQPARLDLYDVNTRDRDGRWILACVIEADDDCNRPIFSSIGVPPGVCVDAIENARAALSFASQPTRDDSLEVRDFGTWYGSELSAAAMELESQAAQAAWRHSDAYNGR